MTKGFMEASHGVFLASVNIFSSFFKLFSYSSCFPANGGLHGSWGKGISFVFIGRAMQVNYEEHDGV